MKRQKFSSFSGELRQILQEPRLSNEKETEIIASIFFSPERKGKRKAPAKLFLGWKIRVRKIIALSKSGWKKYFCCHVY